MGVLGSGMARGSAAHKSKELREEEDWLRRQSISGAVGRIVSYDDWDVPTDDLLGFRRSGLGRVVLTGVRKDGLADRRGIKPGDELKSIDGWTGFAGCPAEVIHSSLVAPVTLVFVGFVGKLQAEVLVERPAEHRLLLPGLASNREVIPERLATDSDSVFQPSVVLCDEVVFLPRDAPLPPTTDAAGRGAMASARSFRRDGRSFHSVPSSTDDSGDAPARDGAASAAPPRRAAPGDEAPRFEGPRREVTELTF